MLDPSPLLRVSDLHVDHVGPVRTSHTVRGVSFDIAPGEIFGLAGESGSGKSTTAQAIMRILPPPAIITGGRAELGGVDLFDLDAAALRDYRWQQVALVFQDAMDVLNPVMTIEAQILDVLHEHESLSRGEADDRVTALLEMVGIDPGRRRGYPHELSGGMRQRVAIAIALALDPQLLIMDEPTTALDVVVQREILDQLLELQEKRRFSILFITHDLALLLEISTRIGIMYGGNLVEVAPAGVIATEPKHPYTQGLLRSFPSIHGPRRRLRGIGGPLLDLRRRPSGCCFNPRCELATGRCRESVPELRRLGPGHHAACHLVD